MAESRMPRPPAGLDDRSRKLWRGVQQGYALDVVETQLLIELCTAVDCCDRIRAQLGETELLVTGSTGQPRVNPLLAALEAQQKLVDKLSASLALSMPGVGDLTSKGSGPHRRGAQARWARRRPPMRIVGA